MVDFVGGPVELEVCETCPNRMGDERMELDLPGVAMGEAAIRVNRNMIVGTFIANHGNNAGVFAGYATTIYMRDAGSVGAFRKCRGPINKDVPAKGLLGKIGLKKTTTTEVCGALSEIFGDSTDATLVEDFLTRHSF